MPPNLTESFEWAKKIEDLPQDRLLKVVAKTTASTIHPEDPTYPVRVFAETELMKNARSLIGRPVGRNHEQMPIYGAYAVDADWNDLEKQLEAILFVPPEYIQKVHDGKIKNVSIEYTWRDTRQTEVGTEFMGLGITRVDLVEGLPPGDPNATVSLFETAEKRGVVLAEVMPKKLGEPFAGYADFAACVAANQDKENPEAYCGAIKAKAEAAAIQPTDPAAPAPQAPAAPKAEELEATITKLSAQITDLEKSQAAKIEAARTDAKREVRAKVKEALGPHDFIQVGRMRNTALVKMRKEIDKALRDDEPSK